LAGEGAHFVDDFVGVVEAHVFVLGFDHADFDVWASGAA
jgi:hypothetical protein